MLTLLRQSESQVFEEIRDFYSIVSLCARILEIQEEVLIWPNREERYNKLFL